jgi:hypothetical protein
MAHPVSGAGLFHIRYMVTFKKCASDILCYGNIDSFVEELTLIIKVSSDIPHGFAHDHLSNPIRCERGPASGAGEIVFTISLGCRVETFITETRRAWDNRCVAHV